MAELFNTIDELKQFVGGNLNRTVELDSIAPIVHDAAVRHIVPYLSLSEYKALVTAHAANDLSPAQTALLPYVRRALANLAVYEYSDTASVQMGESGLFRVESDTHKAVFRYQEKAFREKMLTAGYQALEEMLLFLSTTTGDYAAWAATPEANAHRGLLLNYAADFRRVGLADCDRWTYETLRPIINTVQEFAVQAIVPKAFWSGYLSRFKAGSLTTAEKELLRLHRLAIANYTIEQAVRLQQVQVTKGRVVVVEEFGEQSQVNRTSPVAGNASAVAFQHQVINGVYTNAWRKYLTNNVGSFPTAFDAASGGTNADTDAWHIDTAEEQAAKATALNDSLNQPVMRF